MAAVAESLSTDRSRDKTLPTRPPAIRKGQIHRQDPDGGFVPSILEVQIPRNSWPRMGPREHLYHWSSNVPNIEFQNLEAWCLR